MPFNLSLLISFFIMLFSNDDVVCIRLVLLIISFISKLQSTMSLCISTPIFSSCKSIFDMFVFFNSMFKGEITAK